MVSKELGQVLEKIRVLQRHIRLCRRVIRVGTQEKSRERAAADLECAKLELSELEDKRDHLRDEIESSTEFANGGKEL